MKWLGKQKLVVLLVFGLAGVLYIAMSRAATPTASLEPERGALTGSAVVVADTSASGSSAVKFGSASTVPTCDRTATPSTFASQVSAATAGQTICLSAGNYGSWTGTNKAITLTRQSGVDRSAVVMNRLSIGSGDTGFTLDGLTIDGADITGSASHIAIKNSRVTDGMVMDLSGSSGGIVLDGNDHGGFTESATSCSSTPALITIWGTNRSDDVTVSNSVLHDTNLDGIRPDSPNGATIVNNEFYNIEELSSSDCHHTDSIQFYGGENVIVRGNYFHNSADGIVAYDGTAHNTIENNVIDLVTGRYGIEMYSDTGTIIRHNTLVKRSSCAFNGACGNIMLDHKTADPIGTGTVIENNIVMGGISISNGSVAAVNRNNMVVSGASGSNFNGTPIFVGGTSPTTWADYKLTAGSPGLTGASDGGVVGIR
jgi:parallel beta-helix repeat protein